MKRYWAAFGFLLLIFLAIFLLVEQLQPSLLVDPDDLINSRSLGAALAAITLLVADVVLPIPSSLIMIANGAIFGVPLGTLLSLVGNLGAALVGFFIGRRSESLLARFVAPDERAQANHLLAQWGLLAIIVTRPIPLLAETFMVMAGASTMRWSSMILAALAGSFPVALLYALTGAMAANFDNVVLSFGLTFVMAGLFWGIGHRLHIMTSRNLQKPSR